MELQTTDNGQQTTDKTIPVLGITGTGGAGNLLLPMKLFDVF